MTLTEILNKLESLGTEQNRKIYRRQGSCDNLYGVSFANLNELKKEIISPEGIEGKDLELAKQLWETGNTDARILATMIAEPDKISESTIDKWVNEIDYYMIADYFARCVFETQFRMEKMLEWTQCEIEYIKRTGFSMLTYLAKEDKVAVDTVFIPYVKQIEHEIQTSANRAKEGMNNALIAIGARNENLKNFAHEAAAKIGKIEIDYGETSCKTYDIMEELNKITF